MNLSTLALVLDALTSGSLASVQAAVETQNVAAGQGMIGDSVDVIIHVLWGERC